MNKEEYGEKFRDHLIEQYKLYVEMADRISIRRARTNKFYISLLSGLLLLLSIVVERDIFTGFYNVVFMAFAIFGLLLCFLWYININSYRQLNSGKFRVIHEMEQHLPFPCYDREWEILEGGKDRKKYFQLTRVEQYVPFALSISYLFLLAYSLYMWIFGG